MTQEAAAIDLLLLDLIRDQLNVDVAHADVDLIETGLLDSLSLVMLISLVEETFACELPLDDFDVDNFRSVRRLTEYLDTSGVLVVREAWSEEPP
jgi:D-alanine--poly(phosphoribitol) ligase subunit 2